MSAAAPDRSIDDHETLVAFERGVRPTGPTIRWLVEEMDLSSSNLAYRRVQRLLDRGWVRRSPLREGACRGPVTEQTPLRVRQREQTVKGLRFDSKGVYVHAL